MVTIDAPGSSLMLPDKLYTLVIEGGGDIFIKDNLYYPANGSPSFGIILIAEETGKGANAFISPEPTNIAGILYTEGSLLGMDSEGRLYVAGSQGNNGSGDIP